jgi:hypothetical protein
MHPSPVRPPRHGSSRRRCRQLGPMGLLAALLTGGCGEDGNAAAADDARDAAGGAGATDACSGTAALDEDGDLVVVLEDRHDYSFESNLEIASTGVAAATELSFDWSGVTRDMLGHPFDPLTSVDMVELMIWHYAEDDLVRDLGSDDLDTSNLIALGQLPTENTRTSVSLFEIRSPSGGTIDAETLLEYVDPVRYPPEDHAYVIMVAEGTTLGKGTRMIALFEPDPAETTTDVRMADDSTQLDYTADLSSLDRVAIPAGTADVILDWSDEAALTTTATGKPWFPTRITDVQVAHYAERTLEELEDEFLDLEFLADELYSLNLSAGQSVSLSRLTDANGTAFPGIDDVGVWVVALKCGSCSNPAPLFLTVLEPCS